MTRKTTPEGFNTVTPYLSVANAAGLMEFMQQVFDAQAKEQLTSPDGVLCHAMVRIGDSGIMLGEPKNGCEPMPAALYLYVADVDDTFKRAVEAGSASMLEPVNQFWGDRMAVVKDAWGNTWEIATHVEDVAPEEMKRRMAAYCA